MMVSNEGAAIFFIAARAKKGGPGEHWDAGAQADTGTFWISPARFDKSYKMSGF